MGLLFLSDDFIGFRIDAKTGRAFGQILVRYHKNETPPFVETAQVYVTCPVFAGDGKWKTKRRLRKAAHEKLAHVENMLPPLIKNIFKV